MNTNPHRWLQAAGLALAQLFGLPGCGPDGDGTPSWNDCEPSSPGGGQIDECDCPDNPATPERCFDEESDVDTDTDTDADTDTESDDADNDGVPEESDCNDSDASVGAAQTWHYDDDEDGFGVYNDTQVACSPPTHYVADGGDCDDSDNSVHPGASETCDYVDSNCDGSADAELMQGFYADDDQDGYGDPNESEDACALEDLDGFVENAEDCDDGDAANSPSGEEVCDGADNDCDGTVDEDEATDAVTWYTDADGDGHGDPSGPTDVDCAQPAGYAASADDCDDGDDSVYLGAVETDCDNIDNDCDGVVQESEDCDGDGVTSDLDCEDTDVENWPFNSEDCSDGQDNDCDEAVDLDDEDCSDESDDDSDGQAEVDGDCDDADPTTYLDAEELEDGVDNDCDGVIDEGTEGYDDDGDGVSDSDGDCNDADATVSPNLAETCDDYVDNDCNGIVDDGCPYIDADGDGYTPILDCDDTDASVNPGAEEVAGDGVDQNCDGEDLSSLDVDDDLDGYTENEGDCDDTTDLANPIASEACADGADNDCDGNVDETTCVGTIDCSDNGSTLNVAINGLVTTGLMAPLASTPTEVCITSWDTGAETCTAFLGDSTALTFEVNLADLTPSATDGVTEEWFDLQDWSASGNCTVAEDGLGGYVVEYVP